MAASLRVMLRKDEERLDCLSFIDGREFSESIAHCFLRFWVFLWKNYEKFLRKGEKFHFEEFLQDKSPEEQKVYIIAFTVTYRRHVIA